MATPPQGILSHLSSGTVCQKATIIPAHTGIYRLHLQAQESLGTGSLRDCVRLPYGVARDEWIAANSVGIYEELVMLVTVLEGTCTRATCPRMTCGKHIVYQWADESNPIPQHMPAIDYMNTLLDYAIEKFKNPDVVPQRSGPFPKDFLPCMQTLHKRFFRVYAHAYIHHFATITEHEAEKHVNFCFKHWLFFAREFSLVEPSDMAPLKELVEKFEAAADVADSERRAEGWTIAVSERPWPRPAA